MRKIFASLLIGALALTGLLTGFLSSKDSSALPNNGIVKNCAEIKTDKAVTTGILLWCVDRTKPDVIQESLRGPMIVNVFGSWCWPCRDEIPYFRDFYKKYQKDLQLVGIAVEENAPKDTQDFIVGMGITWPSLYDPDGRTRLNIGMGVPVTLFLDQNGKVVGKIVGAVQSEKALVDATNKYLGLNLH